jgi:hypothetical protein
MPRHYRRLSWEFPENVSAVRDLAVAVRLEVIGMGFSAARYVLAAVARTYLAAV